MPSYNCAGYIDESIRSVLNQSYKDLELIVVDGGSLDGTDDVVKRYAARPNFIYMKKPGCGISAARNLGIKMAKGAWVAFLDADDLFAEDKILHQAEFLARHGEYPICYTNTFYINDDGTHQILSTYHNFSGDLLYFLKRNNFIHPSATMARKTVFDGALFDEGLPSHEDWDLFLRLALKGVKFGYIREPLTKIRVRRQSTTTNTPGMDNTRREVGLRAKRLWGDFKEGIGIDTAEGRRALRRYMTFKLAALIVGFPRAGRFNRPTPPQLLKYED